MGEVRWGILGKTGLPGTPDRCKGYRLECEPGEGLLLTRPGKVVTLLQFGPLFLRQIALI